MQLKGYQAQAVDELYENIDALLNMPIQDASHVLLKAPTGAGKTVMLAHLLDKLGETHNRVCFIWISIGSGALHLQSANSVRGMSKYLNILTSEDVLSGHVRSLGARDALFLSWDQMRNKNAQGNWDNLIMREGEQGNLHSILNETRLMKIKVVLVIDESHMGTGTVRAAELLELIGPEAVVSVSATPRKGNLYYNTVIVSTKDVVKDGMIKSSISINPDILYSVNNEGKLIGRGGSPVDVVTALLGTALKKRKTLKTLYKAHKTKINPLVLIQIPNSDEGDTMLQSIISVLEEEHDITFANGKLAAWFSSDVQKQNLQNIEQIDGVQECLIFKTAIATGWDCPRAQILVKFRFVKSETFSRQVVGRILRMPEQKHYRDEKLNTAYIYTNEETFTFDADDDIEDFRSGIDIMDITAQARQSVYVPFPTVHLPKDLKAKMNTIYMMRDVLTKIAQHWPAMEQQSNLLQDSMLSIAGHMEIKTENLESGEILDSEEEMVKLVHDETQLEIKLKKILAKVLQSKTYLNEVLGMLREFRSSVMPVKRGRRRRNFFSDYYKILINNESMLLNLITTSLEDSKSWKYPYIDPKDIVSGVTYLAETLNINGGRKYVTSAGKCYFTDYPLTTNNLIDEFLKNMDNDSQIEWWYPNYAVHENTSKIRYAFSQNGLWGYVTPDIIYKELGSNSYKVVFFALDSVKAQIVNETIAFNLQNNINLPHIQYMLISLDINKNYTDLTGRVATSSGGLSFGNNSGGVMANNSEQVSLFGSFSGAFESGIDTVDPETVKTYTPSDDLDSILKGLSGGNTTFKF